MADGDLEITDYFHRFIVPLAAVSVTGCILLLFYRKVHPKFYVFIYRGIAHKHHAAIEVQKKKLFSGLAGQCGENERLHALEIGCGPGKNFGIYPPNTSLTVVEPNENFLKDVADNAACHPQIDVVKFLSVGAEDLKEHIPDSSQDVVVCTLTLCSVRDVDAVIREVYRVLKPGGPFYFIEHTRAQAKGSWTHLWQCVMTPWVLFFAHCNPTRTPWVAVDRGGFAKVRYTSMDIPGVPMIFRSHVFGYAIK